MHTFIHFAARTSHIYKQQFFSASALKRHFLFNQMQMQLFIVESENTLFFDAIHMSMYAVTRGNCSNISFFL